MSEKAPPGTLGAPPLTVGPVGAVRKREEVAGRAGRPAAQPLSPAAPPVGGPGLLTCVVLHPRVGLLQGVHGGRGALGWEEQR